MSSPSDNRPSLNDPKVVEKILIDMAKEGIGCRIASAKGIIRDEDANTIEEKEIENRTRIFLNRDKNYAINPEWHKAGAIDAFLAKALSLEIRGSEEIIKAALSQFMWDVRERLNIVLRPDITETEWREEIKDIVLLYRELFQGMARSTISMSGQTQIWTKSGETAEVGQTEFVGDPSVTEKVLVALARESLNAHRAVVSGLIKIQDAAFIEEKEIEARTRIFLGRDKSYAIDGNWNKPGAIDVFLAKELKISTRGAENIIKEALAKFLVQVRQHFDVSQHPDFTEAEWKAELQNDISAFRDLFIGLQPQSAITPATAPTALQLPPEFGGEIPTTIFERKNWPMHEPLPEAEEVAAVAETNQNDASQTIYVTKPFLADPEAVEKILTNFVRGMITVRAAAAKQAISEQDAHGVEEKELLKRTKIFLGQDNAYASDAGWNVAGALDRFLAKQLGIDEDNPEQIIKGALRNLLVEVQQILDLANNPGIAEQEWQPQIQPLLNKYRNLFVGLPWVQETVMAEPANLSEIAQTQGTATEISSQEEPLPTATASIHPDASSITELAPVVDPSPPLAAAGEPEKRGGGFWKLAAVLLLLGVVAYVFIPGRSRISQQSVKKDETVATAPVKTREQNLPKVYDLKNGKLVAHVMDGSSVTEKELQFNGTDSEGGADEGRPIAFWYDIHSLDGFARFLIATQRDPSFSAEYGAPEAFDLYFTDQTGNEKLIHKSVFRAKFSPDGSKIAYITSQSVLHVIDLTGKELARTTRAYEPNWSSDGKAVLYERVPDGHQVYPPAALQLARFSLETQQVEIILDGRFDDIVPHYHPSGNWILFVSGDRTGGGSFWKVPATGGEPKQLTNLHFGQGDATFVPTPHKTMVWSEDGRWFLYDFKTGPYEETWGLEFDDKGTFRRAVKLADGLSPQWVDGTSFYCKKRSGEGSEMVLYSLPKT